MPRELNKSALIRDYLRDNPGVRTKDVVEHFKSIGLTVSNQLVSIARQKQGVGGEEVRESELGAIGSFIEQSNLDTEVAGRILHNFANLVESLGGVGRFRLVLSSYMKSVDPVDDDPSYEDDEEDRGTGSSYIDVNDEDDD